MKKLFMLSVILFMGFLHTFAFTGNNNHSNQTQVSSKNAVEVLYFHGKQRCVTCNAIERLVKEVISTDFSSQEKSKKVQLQVIDISKKENQKLVQKYEVAWSSLFVIPIVNGKEGTPINLTKMGFSYAKNQPEVFKQKFKESLTNALK